MKKYFLTIFFFIVSLIGNQYTLAQESEIFIFPHTVNRLFNIPTSKTLRSFDLEMTLGSHFNDSGIEQINGTVGLGLFNFSEFQFSSLSSDATLYGIKNNFNQLSTKITVFQEGIYLPGLSVGSKLQIGWINNNLDLSEIINNAKNKSDLGLFSINFNQRSVQYYLVISKRLFSTLNLHFGMIYNQIFIKNLSTEFDYGNASYYEKELTKSNIEAFSGLNFVLNGRTKFMIEIMSAPNFDINLSTGQLLINRKTLINVGMRTFMNSWMVVEYGLHYNDKYNKLENIQLRVGITAFWNL